MHSNSSKHTLFDIFSQFYIYFGTTFGYLPPVTDPTTNSTIFGSKSFIIRSVFTILIHITVITFAFTHNSVTPQSLKAVSILDRTIVYMTGLAFNALFMSISIVAIVKRKDIQKIIREFFVLLEQYKRFDTNFDVKEEFSSYIIRKTCLDFTLIIAIEIMELTRTTSLMLAVYDLSRFVFNNMIYSFVSVVFYLSLLFAGYGIENISKSFEGNQGFFNDNLLLDTASDTYEKIRKFVEHIGLLFQRYMIFFSLSLFLGLLRSVNAFH